MSKALRASAVSALIASYAVFAGDVAHADPDRAERLNEEGHELFDEEEYTAAIDRFQRAADLHPDPRYTFNLCFAFYMRGDLYDALDACEEVQAPPADEELIGHRDRVLGWIDEEFEEVGEDPHTPPGNGDDGGFGDPGDPDDAGTQHPPDSGSDTSPPADGTGHGDGQQVAYRDDAAQERRERRMGPEGPGGEIPHDYNWSMGLEGGVMGNNIGGDAYQNGGLRLRAFGDLIFSPQARLGGQVYLDFGLIGADDPVADGDGLLVTDLGGALYQHIPLAGNFYLTPLAGAHISWKRPQEGSGTFVAAGARAQGSLDVIFGEEDEHAITIAPIGLNAYTSSVQWSGTRAPSEVNLDSASWSYSFTVGYRMRFSDPLGESITLH